VALPEEKTGEGRIARAWFVGFDIVANGYHFGVFILAGHAANRSKRGGEKWHPEMHNQKVGALFLDQPSYFQPAERVYRIYKWC
jgi:hypothetical protein